jgi:hypothetical protein
VYGTHWGAPTCPGGPVTRDVRPGKLRKRFIDDYDVLLLDMGNTFMLGVDRFGDGVD